MSRGVWRSPINYAGSVRGFWEVLERLTPWQGRDGTVYRVRLPCCGRVVEKTHAQIMRQCVSGRPPTRQCATCIRPTAAKASRTERPIEANRAELVVDVRSREQEAHERAARIAARRAEWEVRTREAHEWQMGRRACR